MTVITMVQQQNKGREVNRTFGWELRPALQKGTNFCLVFVFVFKSGQEPAVGGALRPHV